MCYKTILFGRVTHAIICYDQLALTVYKDTEQKLLGSIQIAQNKLARFLNGRKLQDKIPTKEIFKELKIPSVNQINAQIKLLEILEISSL